MRLAVILVMTTELGFAASCTLAAMLGVSERRFPFEQVFPLRVSAVTALKFGAADTLSVAADKPDSDETRFGNWRKRIEQGPDSWVISLDYVADTSRFDPDDYGDFAEFHRRLVGSIEQPLILN